MRYAIWNNKGGVGKSFLSFVLGTEIANQNPEEHVILVDMCPQANLSEIILGGNGNGAEILEELLQESNRLTVGGYFDARISSPHQITGRESRYLQQASDFNPELPDNLSLIVGDPSLEIQAQVISQIGSQTLPMNSWESVHKWLLDLVIACVNSTGTKHTTVLIDCNPSFSAYTELAMMTAELLIIPCSSDGSSARAINNVGALLYGIDAPNTAVSFKAEAGKYGMSLPRVHSVLFNRSTIYNRKASKAFQAMFDEIKERVEALKSEAPQHFVGNLKFHDVPDTHSVAIVCSHLGLPLYALHPGPQEVHDARSQVNEVPLKRYKDSIASLLTDII